MTVRLQNKFNKETNQFQKDLYEVRETDKSIAGRLSVSKKNPEGQWVSTSIAFVAFKNDIDSETATTLLRSNGKSFMVEGEPMADFNKEGKAFIKFKVNKARPRQPKTEMLEEEPMVTVVTSKNTDEIPF